MKLQFHEQRRRVSGLRIEYVLCGMFMLIVVGVSYLVDFVTGRSTSLKDFWWLALAPLFAWLEIEFNKLRSHAEQMAEQMNAKLDSIVERLDRIEQQQGKAVSGRN